MLRNRAGEEYETMKAADAVEPVLQSLVKAERYMTTDDGTRMVGVMDAVAAPPTLRDDAGAHAREGLFRT